MRLHRFYSISISSRLGFIFVLLLVFLYVCVCLCGLDPTLLNSNSTKLNWSSF